MPFSARLQTFVPLTQIESDFLNAFQDGLVTVSGEQQAHAALVSNPHGSTQTVTVKYVAPLFESLAPAETRYLDPASFVGAPDFLATAASLAGVSAVSAFGSLYLTAANSTPYTGFHSLPLRPGDELVGIELKVEGRTAGSVKIEILHHTVGAIQLIADAIVNSGTGTQTATWAGSHIILADRPYQMKLIMANGGSSSDIYAQWIKLAFNRTKR